MKAIGVRAEQKGRTHGRYRPAQCDKQKVLANRMPSTHGIYLNDPAKTPKSEWLTQLCVPIRTEPDPRKLLHVCDAELELEA